MLTLEKRLPQICLIDENPQVHQAWQRSIGHRADIQAFATPFTLLQAPRGPAQPTTHLRRYYCMIVARHFRSHGLDMLQNEASFGAQLQKLHQCPVFLTWHSPVKLVGSYAGVIQQAYGLKWQSLQGKVQAVERRQLKASLADPVLRERKKRCQALLMRMAQQASLEQRALLIGVACTEHLERGIRMLERIHNHLLTYHSAHRNFPSHLISFFAANCSPYATRSPFS